MKNLFKAAFTSTEPNCLASTLVFTAALVLESVSAFDVSSNTEYPSSLRITALVLVGVLGSPPIQEGGVFAQRLIAGILLLAVGIVGQHEGAAISRLADAIFLFVVSAGGLASAALGGVESAQGTESKNRVPYPHALHIAFFTVLPSLSVWPSLERFCCLV